MSNGVMIGSALEFSNSEQMSVQWIDKRNSQMGLKVVQKKRHDKKKLKEKMTLKKWGV